MCGIAGIMMKNGAAPSPAQLQHMMDAMQHRGPDGSGTYIKDDVALAHLRLAIIDPAGGQQPLHGAGCTLVGNGEIYNYIELKAQHFPDTSFTTGSDFEPVLHLIARDGIDAINQLRGMYAFALLLPDGRMILARDRFGIKPLYYLDTAECFAFASEAAALLPFLGKPALQPAPRNELMQRGYSSGTETIYAHIKRFLPGEVQVIKHGHALQRTVSPLPLREREVFLGEPQPELAEGEASLEKRVRGQGTFQYNPSPVRPAACHPLPQGEREKPQCQRLNFEQAIQQFDRVFEESVMLHQRSDVPYGMFLSGGLDSTAILTMMARLNSQPVLAFTCGFDSDAVSDERAIARETTRALGAQHVEVEFTEKDFWELLPQVAVALDDPIIDYAILPTFRIAAEAKKHVKVILSGEGGDEVLAGYGRYRKAAQPWWLGGGYKAKGRFAGLNILRDPHPEERPAGSRLEGWLHRSLQHSQIKSGTSPSRRAFSAPQDEVWHWTKLQRAQTYDFCGWLPDGLLIKLDRCLMRHGLEGRTPFLDPEVFNFCFNLPDDFKIRGRLGKYLLRAWLAKYGTKTYDPFAKKRGFTVPVGDWIFARGGKIGEWVASQECIAEIAYPEKVRALFTYGNAKQHTFPAWSLMFYAVWYNVQIEQKAVNF